MPLIRRIRFAQGVLDKVAWASQSAPSGKQVAMSEKKGLLFDGACSGDVEGSSLILGALHSCLEEDRLSDPNVVHMTCTMRAYT